MCWVKRDMWKLVISFAGLLLILISMVWVPATLVGAHGKKSGLAPTATVRASPTVDVTATMNALQEDKLRQEIQQLESQTQNQNNWLFTSSTALIAATAIVIVALFGIYQWAGNRRDERRKELIAQEKELKDREEERRKEVATQDKELRDRAEERFKAAVTSLGDENESVRINGAIMLRSFLHEEDKEIYGRYYTQIFDMAVACLRLPNASRPSRGPDRILHPQKTTDAPMWLTTLRQALTVIFREALPLVREQHKDPQPLDASAIKLDRAFLMNADLRQAWLIYASLRKCRLFYADLSGAELTGADLRDADLRSANLSNANLQYAKLSGVDLSSATLEGIDLDKADLSNAILKEVNLEDVLTMEKTDLRGVKGLTRKQLRDCKAKGAIIDEDITISRPSQPSTPPSPQSQQ